MQIKRIGLLTGGGDSPGINAAIRAVVRRAWKEKIEVLGYANGWAGPLEGRARVLDRDSTSGILPIGGTILGSSRTNPFKIDGGPQKIITNLRSAQIDVLIAIGGDDTLGVAHRLAEYDVNVIGIPQTIDNDLALTDYSIGFASALTTITDALDKLHTTAHSHHRVLILEVMGRDSGWLGLLGGLAGGADIILIPEIPFSVSAVYHQINERKRRGRHFSIIVISEGASPQELAEPVVQEKEVDPFGHVKLGGIGDALGRALNKFLDLPARVTTLAYLQRGGISDPFDRILATRFGVAAVEFAGDGLFDKMTALQGNDIIPVNLADVLAASPQLIDNKLIELAALFD
ncbi:6-phosphofructokinase [Candidatus Acetothermia bacterium]|nr:6-phosphofructokinase [Candidatus Acetothermia bacterium]